MGFLLFGVNRASQVLHGAAADTLLQEKQINRYIALNRYSSIEASQETFYLKTTRRKCSKKSHFCFFLHDSFSKLAIEVGVAAKIS